jgi:dTDP-glucose 4,6-dehydratase
VTRTVIYGAAGFVGATLLTGEWFAGVDLVLVDPMPVDPAVRRAAGRTAASVEIRPATSLRDVGEADVLLVLAGRTDVDQALAEPAPAFAGNGAIALEAAEWWRRHPGARVVYLSTDEVLGESDRPLTEDAPYRPTQPYAASKAAAEMTLRCYQDAYGMDLVVIRSCNLVGGRQRARKLLPIAVRQIATGGPIPVYGAGHHRREYLAVEDLAGAVGLATSGELGAGIYHCSSGLALTILEVLAIVGETLGVEIGFDHTTDRLVHDRAYAMDPARLHAHGWKPHTPPATAIARAVADLHAAWLRGEPLTERP